ncbi:fumarylacetoacetate hydrolase family protein [Leucobacter denitrificans]|uniref:Fumarylacetoacetate hydrolase family protein n=1 Tax=Leucobacter denitrificans TaxID=683042 RepID=A0A7G9S2S3_9MICO|nr:fumarylacetoacetate hydrolase family protein [Leucobacter denitrificans]QNN62148.1 fumarylacetoacetate hydrolase family protein [Leucobacter denitrificans]
MRLATLKLNTHSGAGATFAAVGDSAGWVHIDTPNVQTFISHESWRAAGEAALREPTRLAEGSFEFLTPVPQPAKVICCGLNYHDHIVETGREVPEYPTLFAKFADTLTGPADDIAVSLTSRVDWEAELAVVIGREIYQVNISEARAAILGYTVANDISMRDWQQRTLQWFQGKTFDRTTPVGPCIVTADEIDPVDGLDIECRINGKVVQSSNTRELVFDSARLVAYVSSFTRLQPGDIILTGTPGGVALGMENPQYMRNGDTVETFIEGIGGLRNTIRMTPTH